MDAEPFAGFANREKAGRTLTRSAYGRKLSRSHTSTSTTWVVRVAPVFHHRCGPFLFGQRWPTALDIRLGYRKAPAKNVYFSLQNSTNLAGFDSRLLAMAESASVVPYSYRVT